MKDDRLYLIHIQECIERIEEYTQEGKEKFITSTKTQDAVLRNLHTLAESTQRISTARKEKHTAVDWQAIAGFRNVLVHDYLGIDTERIWHIIQNDLPSLKQTILAMLDTL